MYNINYIPHGIRRQRRRSTLGIHRDCGFADLALSPLRLRRCAASGEYVCRHCLALCTFLDPGRANPAMPLKAWGSFGPHEMKVAEYDLDSA